MVIIGSHPQERGKKKTEKKMKCERSAGVGEAEKRKRDEREREKESGWERPTVAMETGSYQLTPCFPLVPHPPPTPFPLPHSPFIFPSLHPQLSLPFILFFLFHSLTPSNTTTPFSPFSPTPPASSFQHLSLSTSTTPLFLPTSPSHPLFWLHFHTLALIFFLPSHVLLGFFLLSTPFLLFSQLLRLNPQIFAKSSKEKTERLKSNRK